MTKATLVYNTTEIEVFIVVFRGSKTSEYLRALFDKYRNIEILETCEIDVIKIDRLHGDALEQFKKQFKEL